MPLGGSLGGRAGMGCSLPRTTVWPAFKSTSARSRRAWERPGFPSVGGAAEKLLTLMVGGMTVMHAVSLTGLSSDTDTV